MPLGQHKEGAIMKTKRGRNPNRKEKLLLSKRNLNADNWLVVECRADMIVIRHKISGTERNIEIK